MILVKSIIIIIINSVIYLGITGYYRKIKKIKKFIPPGARVSKTCDLFFKKKFTSNDARRKNKIYKIKAYDNDNNNIII